MILRGLRFHYGIAITSGVRVCTYVYIEGFGGSSVWFCYFYRAPMKLGRQCVFAFIFFVVACDGIWIVS